MSIRFNQSCPTCGRRLDVRASLLGCQIACQHCGAEFVATANEDLQACAGDELLARADAALRKAEKLVSTEITR